MHSKTHSKVVIRCLSVQQPFASEIFADKWCEVRSKPTSYRGELFIHASRLAPYYSREDCPECSFPVGVILGKVQLLDCLSIAALEAIREGDIPPGKAELAARLAGVPESSWSHVGGPYCWILAEPRLLAEMPQLCGALGIWRCEAETRYLKFKPVGEVDSLGHPLHAEIESDDSDDSDSIEEPETDDEILLAARSAVVVDQWKGKIEFRTRYGIVTVSTEAVYDADHFSIPVAKALRKLLAAK